MDSAARALSEGSAVLTSGRGPQGDRERGPCPLPPSLPPEYLRPGRLSPGSLTLSHTRVPPLSRESHVFTLSSRPLGLLHDIQDLAPGPPGRGQLSPLQSVAIKKSWYGRPGCRCVGSGGLGDSSGSWSVAVTPSLCGLELQYCHRMRNMNSSFGSSF